jgi:peptidoglycan hydrolase CwlO-like protein
MDLQERVDTLELQMKAKDNEIGDLRSEIDALKIRMDSLQELIDRLIKSKD